MGQMVGVSGLCLEGLRIDEEDEMSWLLPSPYRIPLVLQSGPNIWRRAAVSDVIWRKTVEYRW